MPKLIPRRFVVLQRCKIGNTLHQPGEEISEVFDRPFDRLLTQGVLRLHLGSEAPAPAPAPKPKPDEHVDLELSTMTKKELLATAKLLGVKASVKMNKATIIEAIEAV